MTDSSERRDRREYRACHRTLLVERLEDRKLLATIDLANLGTGGTTIFGADAGDYSGFSVSGAGDVNGDGYDDMLIGAIHAAAASNAKFLAGESYLIFGGPSLPGTIDLASLASAGTKIYGADTRDYNGSSVSGAGDVNGDGFDDLFVGSVGGDGLGNAKAYAGDSYILFGKATMPATIDLASLGTAGVTIFGADAYDNSGILLSRAGDVNGDGFDDVIIGANGGDAAFNSKSDAGDSYVIFGKASWPITMSLSSIGSAGVTIYGADIDDQSGISVSAAGDVNGDGFDDIIVGAYTADAASNAKANAGESYIIYGAAVLPTSLSLAALGSLGTTIFGAEPNDQSGVAVSSAGDVDGDGFDDLIVGARYGDGSANGKLSAGDSYLIFGMAFMPATIELATLGDAGVTFLGADTGDLSGIFVGRAGDVNGDGFDDLLMGAYKADSLSNGRIDAGETYLIFGNPGLPATLDLSNLGTYGVTIYGVNASDQSGFSVKSAGDVNGDGFDDLIIGAYLADALNNLKADAGESYLVYGLDFTSTVTHLGTSFSETLTGTSGPDVMVGGRGNDILMGNGDADVLIGGQGDDVLAVNSLLFQRIVGGSGFDTLRLDTSGKTLDLPALADNRFLGIEQIDINGTGSNTLTLSYREVLNISDESNKLIVRRNSDDIVNIGSGWTQGSFQTIGLDTFAVYTQGAAILWVQSVSLVLQITSGNRDYDKTPYAATSTIYGNNPPTPTVSFVYYSDAAGINVTSAPINVGTYYVRAMSAANAGNSSAQSPLATFQITRKSVTVTGITANNKVYDGTTTATLNTSGAIFNGIIAGDTLTLATATGNFVNANVGSGKTVNITGLVLGGADAINYTLASSTVATTANINSVVVNRRIFYNGATTVGGVGATGFGASNTVGSSFAATSGNPPASAIDTKDALLPGGNSSFLNYTNVVFGINGILIDLKNPTATITAADFSFATGETLTQPGFTTLVGTDLTDVNPQVTQFVGGGINGSTRAKITFNNNSLKNIWLKVTVLANANSGLAIDDVLYFGNVVGEVNGSDASSRYSVNSLDTGVVRTNQSTPSNSVSVTNLYDFNKSGNVNALDTAIVRTYQQSSGVVKVISNAPSSLAFGGEGEIMAPSVDYLANTFALGSEEEFSQLRIQPLLIQPLLIQPTVQRIKLCYAGERSILGCIGDLGSQRSTEADESRFRACRRVG